VDDLVAVSAQISYYLQLRTRATSFIRHTARPACPPERASRVQLRRSR
jgi:hypothetical protein